MTASLASLLLPAQRLIAPAQGEHNDHWDGIHDVADQDGVVGHDALRVCLLQRLQQRHQSRQPISACQPAAIECSGPTLSLMSGMPLMSYGVRLCAARLELDVIWQVMGSAKQTLQVAMFTTR